jgi:ADP-heptose:LPS heptosyltransferase
MSLPVGKRLKKTVAAWAARRMKRPKLAAVDLLQLQPRRILIVRQHNQMGDMVCATPAFRALRETYPTARLALVCAPLNFEVVRANPQLDNVFLFDKQDWRRPWRFWRLGRALRVYHPDLVFVLNSVSFSLTSALLAHLSGAPLIVGGDSLPFGWDFSRHAYSLELPSSPEVDRHAIAHSLAPLAEVGITTDDLTTVVVPTPTELGSAQEFLASLPGEGPIWILHPGAGKRQNLWPAARFADVASRASARGARVLVLHGPADQAVLDRFLTALSALDIEDRRQQITIAPIQPVGVCAALLSLAERFLCNDTGLMHVAGAVGVPTLALFGPTDPQLWKPLAETVVALQGADGDLKSLDQELVWETYYRLPLRGRQG